MRRRAFAVMDLGFGDAGKGLVTDALVRRTGATAVVRFNGGAQASHNVVTADGRHHAFSQFGSGTFVRGVRTLLSRHVVIDPPALLVEERALREAGVTDGFSRLRVHPAALVATPYHRALNCLRETRRGLGRHGSCGVGFGETVQHALADPNGALRARDLLDPAELRRKLARLAEEKLAELQALGGDAVVAELEAPGVAERVLAALAEVGRIGVVTDERGWEAELRSAEPLVFEGAQGVLLCERHGFPPHTTWSRCDLCNVDAIVAEAALDLAVTRVGVLRSVAVRHGPGPLPTEAPELAADMAEPHNRDNPWQGPVRYGWFDAVLGRYAVAVVGGIDALAITHMDTIETMRSPLACHAYELDGREVNDLCDLLPSVADDAARLALGARLREVRPRLERFSAHRVAERLGCDVAIESRGPSAEHVTFLRPP